MSARLTAEPVEHAGAGPRDRVRLVAAVVLVAAIVALAIMAIASNRSVRSITEVRPAAAVAPTPLPDAPASDVPVHATPGASGGPVGDSPPFAASPAPRPVAVPPAVDTQPAPAPGPAVPPDGASAKACPSLGLPAPAETGGLASAIAIVPLFGPFSAEAFSFVPALEPGIAFFGPFMPQLERALGELAPVLELITPGARSLGQAGFEAIRPAYGPVRPQLLDAEADLATSIRPLVAAIAEAPGSECAVALEGVLASVLADRPDLPT